MASATPSHPYIPSQLVSLFTAVSNAADLKKKVKVSLNPPPTKSDSDASRDNTTRPPEQTQPQIKSTPASAAPTPTPAKTEYKSAAFASLAAFGSLSADNMVDTVSKQSESTDAKTIQNATKQSTDVLLAAPKSNSVSHSSSHGVSHEPSIRMIDARNTETMPKQNENLGTGNILKLEQSQILHSDIMSSDAPKTQSSVTSTQSNVVRVNAQDLLRFATGEAKQVNQANQSTTTQPALSTSSQHVNDDPLQQRKSQSVNKAAVVANPTDDVLTQRAKTVLKQQTDIMRQQAARQYDNSNDDDDDDEEEEEEDDEEEDDQEEDEGDDQYDHSVYDWPPQRRFNQNQWVPPAYNRQQPQMLANVSNQMATPQPSPALDSKHLETVVSTAVKGVMNEANQQFVRREDLDRHMSALQEQLQQLNATKTVATPNTPAPNRVVSGAEAYIRENQRMLDAHASSVQRSESELYSEEIDRRFKEDLQRQQNSRLKSALNQDEDLKYDIAQVKKHALLVHERLSAQQQRYVNDMKTYSSLAAGLIQMFSALYQPGGISFTNVANKIENLMNDPEVAELLSVMYDQQSANYNSNPFRSLLMKMISIVVKDIVTQVTAKCAKQLEERERLQQERRKGGYMSTFAAPPQANQVPPTTAGQVPRTTSGQTSGQVPATTAGQTTSGQTTSSQVPRTTSGQMTSGQTTIGQANQTFTNTTAQPQSAAAVAPVQQQSTSQQSPMPTPAPAINPSAPVPRAMASAPPTEAQLRDIEAARARGRSNTPTRVQPASTANVTQNQQSLAPGVPAHVQAALARNIAQRQDQKSVPPPNAVQTQPVQQPQQAAVQRVAPASTSDQKLPSIPEIPDEFPPLQPVKSIISEGAAQALGSVAHVIRALDANDASEERIQQRLQAKEQEVQNQVDDILSRRK